MHLITIHWKNYLLPAGIALVSIWTFYLGAVALFAPLDSTDDDGEARSSQHGLTDSDGGLDTATKTAHRVADAQSEIEQAQGDARSTSRSDEKSSGKPNSVHTKGKPLGKKQVAATGSGSKSAGPHKSVMGLAEVEARAAMRESILKEALALAMKSEKPWQNLIAVAMEQYRRGEKDEAREILLVAEKMAADPDNKLESSIAVRGVVKAMLSQRQTEDAIAALQNIQNSRERERAIAEVAAWSARLGEVDMARNLIQRIVLDSDRDVALVAIAESEASFEGVSAALQTVSSIVNAKKKDDAYRRIALKRGALNDFSSAEQTTQMIRNDKLRDSTLTSLARLRARGGDVSGGMQAIANINDQSMADTSLRELAVDLAVLGRYSSSAYVSTRIRGDQEKSYALERLSVELAKSGDLSGSLVKTDSIPVDSIRQRTLLGVSSVTANKGEPQRARNVAIRISSNKGRDRAYRAIAQAAAADGDHVAAYNTLQEINRSDEKALALVSMARTRQRQGDDRQALVMLEDASRESRELKSVGVVDRIQSDMAVAYAERQESGHSLLLADNIRDPRRRDTTYSSLAKTFAPHDIQAAQQSVLSISSEKIRITTEDAVARTLARKVAPRHAVNRARVLNSERQQIIFLLEVSRKT